MRNGSLRLALALILVLAMLAGTGGFAEEAGEGEEASSSELAILLFDPPPATIEFAESIALAASAPAGAKVAWSSSDEGVAELHPNEDGSVTVTGVGAGAAEITCSLGERTRSYAVTVRPPATLQIAEVEYPSVLRMSGRGWKLGRGTVASIDDLRTLTSAISGADGELIAPAYTQSFERGVRSFQIRWIDKFVPFAQIPGEGQYTWTLTATDASGRSATVHLPIHAVEEGATVVRSAPGRCAPVIVAPEGGAVEMQVGERKALTAKLLSGENAADLIWVSYDAAVATVAASGEVTAVGPGTTTVVCRTLDNAGFSAGCAVTVRAAEAPAGEAGDQARGDGRNLLPGTGEMANYSRSSDDWIEVIPAPDGGGAIMDFQANPTLAWNVIQAREPIPFSLLRNKQVTISLYARSDDANKIDSALGSDGGGLLVELLLLNGTDYTRRQYFDEICYPKLSTQWQRYSATVTLSDDYFRTSMEPGGRIPIDDSTRFTVQIFNRSTYRLQIKQLKLEFGGVATDWTPAPEDAEDH